MIRSPLRIVRNLVLSAPVMLLTFQARAWHYEEAALAAHELSAATEHVHEEAELERHHFTWIEEKAVSDLHELAAASEHLHEQIESYAQDPQHTFDDYQRVAFLMNQAQWSVRRAHFPTHVLSDWYRVDDAFRRLSYEYAGSSHDPGHDAYPPGHGGYYPGYSTPGYSYPIL